MMAQLLLRISILNFTNLDKNPSFKLFKVASINFHWAYISGFRANSCFIIAFVKLGLPDFIGTFITAITSPVCRTEAAGSTSLA